MSKKDKRRTGVIYSTDPEFDYETNETEQPDTLPNNKQMLEIALDKKQRGGKKVTLVSGFIGKEEDLKELGKLLKQFCGVGGSVKDNIIIIQGDMRDKAAQYLEKVSIKHKKR